MEPSALPYVRALLNAKLIDFFSTTAELNHFIRNDCTPSLWNLCVDWTRPHDLGAVPPEASQGLLLLCILHSGGQPIAALAQKITHPALALVAASLGKNYVDYTSKQLQTQDVAYWHKLIKVDPSAFGAAPVHVRSDIAATLIAVQAAPAMFAHATFECRNDFVVATLAVATQGSLLAYCGPAAQHNCGVLTAACSQDPTAARFVPLEMLEDSDNYAKIGTLDFAQLPFDIRKRRCVVFAAIDAGVFTFGVGDPQWYKDLFVINLASPTCGQELLYAHVLQNRLARVTVGGVVGARELGASQLGVPPAVQQVHLMAPP